MFRYIGLFWNEANPIVSATARRLIGKCLAESSAWRTTLDQDGFVVLSAGAPEAGESPTFATPRVLEGACGVVLGDLFRLSHDSAAGGPARCDRLDRLDRVESVRILRSGGRELVTQYWGNYVALMRDPETRIRWVMRGPASTLPCLHVSVQGVDLYFSWTETCARLDEIPISINWKQVARSLLGPLLSPQTGLNEIREILPGYCEETSATRRVHHRYWDPARIAGENPIADFDAAAKTLHQVTKSCVHAWAEGRPRILHGLSGGLDSSIVLGCLQDAPARPEITCFTHFAEGPDSDERAFARVAAQRAHCRHIESQRSADVDLHGVLNGMRLESSPGMRIPEIDRIEPQVALEEGADAIFKGHGGDELFCRHHTRYYVADFLRSRGIHPAVLGLILHSAVTEGETVWAILGGALRDAFVPRRWNMTAIFSQDQENQSLLHPQVLSALLADRSFDLPYVQSTRECPPGKLWQISLITARRMYYNPCARDGDPQNIAPLLSQPIIEVCLRIPTFLQMKDRRDRAVARAAFVQEVPQEILERRDKGGAEQLAWKMLRKNLPFIRELLLDGRLVQERLIDRQRLEAVLSGSPSALIKATVPIFDLLGTEAWLQAWAGYGLRNLP